MHFKTVTNFCVIICSRNLRLSRMTGVKGFLNRWSVTIVMIPALVGMHWGWFVLHKNEALVPKHQQKDELPIVSVNFGRGAESMGVGF